MKKQIEKMVKQPMIIVFIIILIFFTPLAIYSPGENRNRGVVTAIGIDKQDQEYEISLLTFIPTANQSYKEQTSIISGKGGTLAEALYKAQINMGRKVGLAHAKTTVVSKDLLQEDVTNHIDYLSRVASLPENTVFVCSSSSAKKLLEASQGLEQKIGLKLEQLIGFNANNIYVTDTSLEAFYKGYYKRVKSSIIGYLKLKELNDDSQSGGSSKGGEKEQNTANNLIEGGSQSNDIALNDIINEGEAVLLKDGRMVDILSIDELNGINLLNKKALNQIITVNNVELDGEKFDLSYKIKDKKVLINTKFENDIPVFSAQLILGLELVEVKGNHETFVINTEFSKISKDVENALDNQIKKIFTDALKVMRENKTDVLGINEIFFNSNRNSYKKFIEKIGDVDNFIDFVNFKLSLIIQPD